MSGDGTRETHHHARLALRTRKDEPLSRIQHQIRPMAVGTGGGNVPVPDLFPFVPWLPLPVRVEWLVVLPDDHPGCIPASGAVTYGIEAVDTGASRLR